MLTMLNQAQDYPDVWRDIGQDATQKAAVNWLRLRGVVGVNSVTGQCRLKSECR